MPSHLWKYYASFALFASLPYSLSAWDFHGKICFDSTINLTQKAQDKSEVDAQLKPADNLFISKAQLDWALEIRPDLKAHLRVGYADYENDQIGLNTDITWYQSTMPYIPPSPIAQAIDAAVSRAYFEYTGIEGLTLSFGRLPTPDVTSDRIYYQPYIGSFAHSRPVGSVTNDTGDHAGVCFDMATGPISYHLALWQQTLIQAIDLSLPWIYPWDGGDLRLAVAGRMNITGTLAHHTHYGFGVGYNSAPMEVPIIITVAAMDDTDNTFSALAFNTLNNIGADISVASGAYQLNLGVQYQRAPKGDYRNNEADHAALSDDEMALNIFRQDGQAHAFWIEAGMLLQGASYDFDAHYGVISGVKLRSQKSAFEVTARYGTEIRKNILALVSRVGWRDFRTNAAGDTANDNFATVMAMVNMSGLYRTSFDYLGLSVDNATSEIISSGNQIDVFTERMRGFSLGVNTYLSEQAVLKAEYEWKSHDFKRQNTPATWTPSLQEHQVSTFRLRADYSF